MTHDTEKTVSLPMFDLLCLQAYLKTPHPDLERIKEAVNEAIVHLDEVERGRP